MSSVDNRTVKMTFDNTQFKKEALATKDSLAGVDSALAKTGNNKGLLSLGGQMESIRVKASAMQIAVGAAIGTIAAKATAAGIEMAKSLTLDPIKAGFDEYELKMKSIQTILANTKGENLKSVTVALNELNDYSDKTIYNFANMTENIGKLTTAGISLKDATATVKGFSNMVALAGGDANAAAGAMEQFGQGLQAGVIKAQDWMSISNRGLGSQSLQKAFFETARAAGELQNVPLTTTFEEWSKANGGFKGSLETGWLTAETATETLKIMTGDVKDIQELMKMGFDQKTAKDMLKIADNALESATKVRTFTAFWGTFQEQIGSGWSQIMETLIGDFNEATNLFTKMSDVTGAAVGGLFNYLNKTLKAWDRLGGRTAILGTISNLLAPFGAILGAIATAWQEAFGKKETGSALATISKLLELLTRPLAVLADLITASIGPITAFFQLLDIGKNIIKTVAGIIGDLVQGLFNLSGAGAKLGGSSIVTFAKDVAKAFGAAIDQIDTLLDKGASVKEAFGSVDISLPSLPSLPGLPSLPNVTSMFGGGDSGGSSMLSLSAGIDAVTGSVGGLAKADEALNDGLMFNPDADISGGRVRDLGTLNDSIEETTEKSRTLGDVAMPALEWIWNAIKQFFDGFNVEDLMAAINLGVLSTMAMSISRFMNTITGGFAGFANIGPQIEKTLIGVQGALAGYADGQRAKLIMAYALAIAVLVGALWVLSRIPLDKLAQGLGGVLALVMIMKVGLDSIAGAVEKMDGKGTTFKLTGLSLALVALGLAILMLAGAFLILNHVDWSSMLKGLGTIIVVMKMLEALGNVGKHGAKNMLGAAAALTALSFSMVILAGALMLFQFVSWESMAKGGLVLLGLTLAIGALAMIPYAGIAKVGTAMLTASLGFLAMANALLIFGLVSWESIGKGAVALLLLTAALAVLQIVGNPVAISGMIGLGVGLLAIATAMLVLNNVDWSSLGKMALVLVGLLLAFAAFLAIVTAFAPAIIILSAFSGSIALLALALTALMLAFALIFPLMALSAGVFAAFATGAAVAIGVFLTSLALQAPIMKKSILTILQSVIDGIVEAVPMVIDGIKRLWKAIMDELGAGGGDGGGKKGLMEDTGQSWISKLADGIKKKIPEIVKKGVEIITKFLSSLAKYAGNLAAAGVDLVVSLINGISSRISRIVDAAVDLVIAFAQGIANGYIRILNAGVKLIADFLHSLADTIRNGSKAIGGGISDVVDAMRDVGVDMVKGLIGGLDDMLDNAMTAIGNLATGMVNKAKSIFKIKSPSRIFQDIGRFVAQGLTKGIQDNAAASITAVASMVSGSIAIATEYVDKFIQDLDQKALAASARAAGLQAAADKAAKAAEKTKGNKKDDKAAKALQKEANKATRSAEKREAEAERERKAQEREREFEEATLIEKAQMRADDAQATLDSAKAAEFEAESKRQQAKALRDQAKAKGVSNKDAKAFRKQAEKLEKEAEADAKKANERLERARTQATDAMKYQRQAAAAAANDYQARYDAERKSDEEAEKFEAMSDEEKAAYRRRQADELQKKADADLARAKVLAYTDLQAANELAEKAIADANQARDYRAEAENLSAQVRDAANVQSQQIGGTVVNLDPTEAAAIAFGNYTDIYDAAYAAAAGGQTIEFNQYNTSPEALNPTDVYRNTNNQLDFAAGKLTTAA